MQPGGRVMSIMSMCHVYHVYHAMPVAGGVLLPSDGGVEIGRQVGTEIARGSLAKEEPLRLKERNTTEDGGEGRERIKTAKGRSTRIARKQKQKKTIGTGAK